MKDDLTKKQKHDKMIRSFENSARIKECFHNDKEECDGDIISAHSIQRNGKLSLLEEDVNSKKVLYSSRYINVDENGVYTDFKPLGKKQASTFYGFCKHHDTELFKDIETKPFDNNNDKHCFLATYRSFAHEYHAKKEVLQAYENCEEYRKMFSSVEIEGKINGTKLAIRDMSKVRERLNDILKIENFQELDYYTVSYSGLIPIACSSAFSPEYSYRNKILNKSTCTSIVYENVFLTVLPSKDRTDVIFACLPDDKKSLMFIDEISNLRGIALDKAISSIIIAYVENVFISPFIIDKMSVKEKKVFIKEIMGTNPNSRQFYEGFIKCETNLFDVRFIK